jgi:hypothetical protein
MKKCLSSQTSRLPPEADAEQTERVKSACKRDRIRLAGNAQWHINYWRIPASTLSLSVLKHIEHHRKVFRKFDPNDRTKLLTANLQANVTIDTDKDVYVEMILTSSAIVILNAHEHSTKQRLPQ